MEMDTKVVTFSDPVCRYESSADYTNPQTGQSFRIIAAGPDQEGVANFIQKIQVYLEVKPDEPLSPPENLKESESQPSERDDEQPLVTFEVQVIDSGKIDPPFIVDFEIDPPINQVSRTAPQSYAFYSASQVSVTIHANSGNLTASLSGGGPTSRTNVSSPGDPIHSLFGNSNSPKTFFLNVNGQGNFDLSGSYRAHTRHGR
jgi:hypothetical protein